MKNKISITKGTNSDGNKFIEYSINGLSHREDAPAYTEFFGKSKKIKLKIYYNKGVIHNDNGPSIVTYFKSGKIKKQYYYKNGLYYRNDGPAIIDFNYKGKVIRKQYYCGKYLEISSDEELKQYIKLQNIS